MQSAKFILRKQIKEKLKLLSESDKCGQSKLIVQQLLNHTKYKNSDRISVYLSMKNEVQTYDVLVDALNGEKEVFIPKYVGNDMDMVKINSLADYENLPETSWHIKQPLDGDNTRENALHTGGLDLIIVPGVGFTKAGDRLGHGKGYYDAYIDKISQLKKPYLIGLGFSVQMCEEIPTSNYDKHLDEVLTLQ